MLFQSKPWWTEASPWNFLVELFHKWEVIYPFVFHVFQHGDRAGWSSGLILVPGNNSHVTLCPWWNLFGHLKQAFCNWILSLRPCCLGPICCWYSGGLLCFFFASRICEGTYLFVCARQHHQTPNSEADDQVDFACSVGVIFRIMFCYFSLFLRIMRFCENWAPMHARARFWGSGPLWMLCFTTSSPFWKLERSRRLMSRGRGTLSKILSGQVGPPLVARMLIVGTATGYDPKWTTPHRCLGSRLRVVAKELCLILIKSSK